MIVCTGNLLTLFFASWDLARAGQVPIVELAAVVRCHSSHARTFKWCKLGSQHDGKPRLRAQMPRHRRPHGVSNASMNLVG